MVTYRATRSLAAAAATAGSPLASTPSRLDAKGAMSAEEYLAHGKEAFHRS
jgi:hypothetical protein